MLDIKFIRENLDQVKKSIEKRGSKFDLEKLIALDDAKKDVQIRVETLQAEANKLAKAGERTDRAVKIKQMLKDLEPQLADAQENYKVLAVNAPNVVLDDVQAGGEEANEVVKKFGEIKIEKGKDHVELGLTLNLLDIDRAGKVSGSRFAYIKNELVELEFALVRYVLDIVKKENFQPIVPPILVKQDMAWGSGHFEAINDDAYHTSQDEMVVVGTSEQSILPMFAGETMTNLPQRYIGFSTCLRREAGSYGKDVKGILRVHQFDKMEMFSYCTPENSIAEHELIVGLEEKIMQGLELPYQLVKLAAGDIGLPSAKTMDIETWMPGEGRYRETHSSSNCTDFQARRLNIRYKDDDKSGLVHTLNGTAIAIGRILIAIMENYQTDEGSIKVPEILQKYIDFTEIKRK
jgi:seryl-tRNA synthetase